MRWYYFCRYGIPIDGKNYEYITEPKRSLKYARAFAYKKVNKGTSEVQIWATNDPTVTVHNFARFSKMIRIVQRVEPAPRSGLIGIMYVNAIGTPEFYLHKDGTEGVKIDYHTIRTRKKSVKKKPSPFGL